jgi:hypothetical protein
MDRLGLCGLASSSWWSGWGFGRHRAKKGMLGDAMAKFVGKTWRKSRPNEAL